MMYVPLPHGFRYLDVLCPPKAAREARHRMCGHRLSGNGRHPHQSLDHRTPAEVHFAGRGGIDGHAFEHCWLAVVMVLGYTRSQLQLLAFKGQMILWEHYTLN